MRRRELLVGAGVALTGCLHGGSEDEGEDGEEGEEKGMSVTSPNFDGGGTIPSSFTCDGANGSPPLEVRNVPNEAETLALVVDDPDAREVAGKVWVHWLLWNAPADTEEIPRAVSPGESIGDIDGAVQGTNDNGEVGYSGPCPPEGDGPHTYRFTLYALNTTLDLEPGATRDELENAVEGNVVAQTRLEGTYAR